jgi:hypothetical protein
MPFVDAIKRLADDHRVVLRLRGDAIELRVVRDGLSVVFTVAPSVLEWFVDATEESTGAKAHDWCDYAGYDETPRADLEASLVQDLTQLLQGVLDRPLRFQQRSDRLEWEVNGCWQQAVPITVSG